MVCPGSEISQVMNASERPWFEELTVTPLIERAVKDLRAAIPKNLPLGTVGITISSGGCDTYSAYSRGNTVKLAYTQQAAAWLLISVASYHFEHIDATHGAIVNGDEVITPTLQAARARFNEDVKRKLNVKIEGNLGLEDFDGSVTVYV
jgi:hypothetical protein